MQVVSFASGSKGNAYAVGCGGDWLLIDLGLPAKDFLARLETVFGGEGAKSFLGSLRGILVTHSHTDHVAGIRTFLKKHDIPVFANSLTAETVGAQEKVADESFVCFENGQRFDIGVFSVKAFSIPHDTSDPVGYLIESGGRTYFHGTDIGTPLDSIGVNFAEADIATLESNHDPVLLRGSKRPASLIQRIAGARGHLSNEQACDLVRRFVSPKLRHLSLAHLSQDCNAPHIAERQMRGVLREIGRQDVDLEILNQDEPGRIFSL